HPFSCSEIVTFIPTGMLSSRIDKVEDTLITDFEDVGAKQYQRICVASDDLTNQLQRLSRVIDM
ncbi:putative proteasome regulatory subunit Rpn7/26S proteasome subunit 6, PINT domain protein, partial [Gregarina niphandrodes]